VLSKLTSYQGDFQLLIKDDIKLMTSSILDDMPSSMEVKRRADDLTRLPSAASISSNSESSSSPDRSDNDSSRQERRGSHRRSTTLTKGFESEAAKDFFGTPPFIPVDTTPPSPVSVSSASAISSRGRSNSDISGERRVSATRARRSRTMSMSMVKASTSEAAQDFFGTTPVVPDPDDMTPLATVSVPSESNIIARERSNSDISGELRVVTANRPRHSRTMSISEDSISETAEEFFGTPPPTPSRDVAKVVNTQEKLDSKVVMISCQEREEDDVNVKVKVIEATKEEGACPVRETREKNFNAPQAPSGKVDAGCQCIIM